MDMRWKKGVGAVAAGSYSDAFSSPRLINGSKKERLAFAWFGAPGGEAIGESWRFPKYCFRTSGCCLTSSGVPSHITVPLAIT